MLLSASSYAQLSFQFVPEINGRNLDGLFACSISNMTQQKIAAVMTITVTERKAGTVCLVQIPEFTVFPGSNPLPISAARSASIRFSNGRLGQLTGFNKSFPEGDYDYCFSLSFPHSDNPPTEQCFSYLLAPFADLNLLDPYNSDMICDRRPVLTWQPLIPNVSGAQYQLVLTEIKAGQSPTEALNYNLPVFNQRGLNSPVLPYPSIAPELETKKKYAWQVTAYKDQSILNRSEIWMFSVDCPDSTKKPIENNGYRDIADLAKGNFYMAMGAVRFAVVNAYEEKRLKYEITPINDPDKKIRGLPHLKLINGLNQIVIDLEDNGNFKDEQYYILRVWLPNGSTYSLRFLYKETRDE